MVDIKQKETVYPYIIHKKQDLPDFVSRFLNMDYIEDFTVSYAPILKETFPKKFSMDNLESPSQDPLETFLTILRDTYLDKKNFEKVSAKLQDRLVEKYEEYPDFFLYLKSILISVHFKMKPLYSFPQRERDLILKRQDSLYGISTEIDAEKDETNSDIGTEMYSGWIDFRGIDIYNNFRKTQIEEKLNRTTIVLDVSTNADFLALFDHVFNHFTLDTGYKTIEAISLL